MKKIIKLLFLFGLLSYQPKSLAMNDPTHHDTEIHSTNDTTTHNIKIDSTSNYNEPFDEANKPQNIVVGNIVDNNQTKDNAAQNNNNVNINIYDKRDELPPICYEEMKFIKKHPYQTIACLAVGIFFITALTAFAIDFNGKAPNCNYNLSSGDITIFHHENFFNKLFNSPGKLEQYLWGKTNCLEIFAKTVFEEQCGNAFDDGLTKEQKALVVIGACQRLKGDNITQEKLEEATSYYYSKHNHDNFDSLLENNSTKKIIIQIHQKATELSNTTVGANG